MKKIFWIITFVLILNLPVWADADKPHVTAYGTGTVEVTPDEMFWSLKITNKGTDIEEIAKQHSKIVLSVLSLLGETDIAKDDTQTSMMQFGENWEHEKGRRVQKGFFASSQVTFKLTDFTKYQHLWTGLSKIKDMSIQNIGYGYSKRIEAQKKARIKALLAAREKAYIMAKTLGVDLDGPLVIEDNQSFKKPWKSTMLMESSSGSRSVSQDIGGFALGKILINSNVKVVYLIKH